MRTKTLRSSLFHRNERPQFCANVAAVHVEQNLKKKYFSPYHTFVKGLLRLRQPLTTSSERRGCLSFEITAQQPQRGLRLIFSDDHLSEKKKIERRGRCCCWEEEIILRLFTFDTIAFLEGKREP